MKSLRGRLLIGVVVVTLAALVSADLVTYAALGSFLSSRTDQSLRQAVGAFDGVGRGPGVGVPGGPGATRGVGATGAAGGPGPLGITGVPNAPRGQGGSGIPIPQGSPNGRTGTPPTLPPPSTVPRRAPGYFVELRRADGTVRFGPFAAHVQGGGAYSPTLPKSIAGFRHGSVPQALPEVFFSAPATIRGGPPFRVLAVLEPNGDELIVGAVNRDTTLTQLFGVELGVTAGALVAALLLGWWIVRLGLLPLVAVEETAERIAAGSFGERVPGATERTEVGRLARTVNAMLARIEDAFAQRDTTEAELRSSEDRLRRFVADASHELRTPLAAVAAYAELFERGAKDHPEDLERVLSGIRTETVRMSRLVDDLLLLARLDQGRPLEKVSVNLVGLAQDAAATSRAVGPTWPVSLDGSEPVELLGDPIRLRQALDNLLANVRAHTPRGTPASVRVFSSEGFAVVEVADSGRGVETTDPLFERFFREDPARSPGGAGLGLAIVSAIVVAHGGNVEARNGPGLVVTIRLPLAKTGYDKDVEAS